MQNVQKGFTLIELVVVIVLLGILGVTALAKFQDLSGDAQDAANAGVAAELSSGSSINYATESLSPGSGTTIDNSTTCATAAGSLLVTGIPSGYSITTTSFCSGAGETTVCDVTGNAASGAVAVLICTS